MKTNHILLAAALALASALPANAQARPREHVPTRRAVEVTGFQPSSGAVGSLVTIHGKGFPAGTQVIMGGRAVALDMLSSRKIRFRVPAYHGNGRLKLRVPGRGDVPVGRFTVFALLGIEGFSPESGAPGTRVTIRGQGFQPGDRVLMNGRALPVQTLAPGRIVVTIPKHASTDHLTVARKGGVSERSARRFHVAQPAPVITSVWPRRGAPGTRVVLRGHELAQVDAVLLHGQSLPIARRKGKQLEVQIPRGAHSGHLAVRSHGQVHATRFHFDVLHARGLAIAKLSTRRANAGSMVVIWGHGFDERTRVFWGHRELRAQTLGSGRIEVFLPGDARGADYLYVHDGFQRAKAPAPLRIVASSLPHDHARDQLGVMY